MKEKMIKGESMKRILSIIIALAMVITLLPIGGMTAYADVTGTGTESDPYIIHNIEEFKTQLSASEAGKYYKLADDFNDTTEITESIVEFRGILDGNNKTVKISISVDLFNVGIFDTNYGTISNLNVEGSISTSRENAGGICGQNVGTISKCTNNAEVRANETAGGICGQNYGTVKECTNHGTITTEEGYAGGICGQNGTSSEDAYVEKCTNDGVVLRDEYKEYTGYADSYMAYKIGADNEGYKVIGKVGNSWYQIHYGDEPFNVVAADKDKISVTLSPEIISGGKLLKFTVSVRNTSANKCENARVTIWGDTVLGGCDRSTNKSNSDNSMMTMSYSGITFFAFSKDPNFRIVNTDYDNVGESSDEDAVQVDEKCDSAYSARWILDSIDAGATVTRTFYMGCMEGDDLSWEDLNKAIGSAVHTHQWQYSAAGNKLEAYCTAEGCSSGTNENHKLSLTLNAEDKIYSGKAYEASVDDGLTNVTGAKKTITYYLADGTTKTNSDNSGAASEGAAPVNIGSYVAEVTVSDGNQTVSATKAFEITKAEQAATVSMSGYDYGKTVSTPDVSGAEENPNVTYYYSTEDKNIGGTEWKDIGNDTLEPGTYYMYAVLAETEHYNAYTTAPVSFTVQGSDMSGITAEDVTKTYDGNSYGITVNTGSIPNATVTYGTEAGTYKLKECPAYKDAGNYTIYYKVDARGYNPFTGSATVTIEKKKVTATVVNVSKHIGQADPVFSCKAEGLVEGDRLKDVSFERTDGETVGDYELTATAKADSNPNYDVTFVAGTLTIEDHTAVVDKAVDATCTKNGFTEGSHCSVCDEVLVAQTVVDALGHDWSEWTADGEREKAVCNRCGQVKYRNIDSSDTGSIEKDAEVTPDSPVKEAALENSKSELMTADGIFTADEKIAIENGADARVWLEISAINIADADKQSMEAEAQKIMGSDISKVLYFDADLFKSVTKDGTTTKSQITEPGTDIEVSVSLPESLVQADSTISRAYKIIRLHNGEVDSFDAAFDKETGTLTFKTDRFSTYAIAYTDTQHVTGVTISSDSKQITKKGDTLQLTASVTPGNAANQKVKWTSSDSSVATVDENGLVTAVGNGTVTITATTEDGGVAATVKITVDIPSDDKNNNNNNNNSNNNNNDNNDNGNNNNGNNNNGNNNNGNNNNGTNNSNNNGNNNNGTNNSNSNNGSTSNPATTPDNKNNQSTAAPKTGDTSNPMLWVTVMMVSFTGLAVVIGRKKKECK